MQTIPKPKKNAATFRIKKARKVEIIIAESTLKQLKVLQPKPEL
ncbi:hypothetical protein ACFGVR_06325 [Mucilaginibacter sp. AW1-3]